MEIQHQKYKKFLKILSFSCIMFYMKLLLMIIVYLLFLWDTNFILLILPLFLCVIVALFFLEYYIIFDILSKVKKQ